MAGDRVLFRLLLHTRRQFLLARKAQSPARDPPWFFSHLHSFTLPPRRLLRFLVSSHTPIWAPSPRVSVIARTRRRRFRSRHESAADPAPVDLRGVHSAEGSTSTQTQRSLVCATWTCELIPLSACATTEIPRLLHAPSAYIQHHPTASISADSHCSPSTALVPATWKSPSSSQGEFARVR